MFNHLGFAKGVGLNVRTHVLVDNNYTVCTANTKDKKTMEPENGLDWKDVDCKKCMRTAFYKEAIQNLDPPEPPKDKKATKKKETKKKIVKKITNKDTKKQEPKEPEIKTEKIIHNDENTIIKEITTKTQIDHQEDTNKNITNPIHEDCICSLSECPKKELENTIIRKVGEFNIFLSEIIHSIKGMFYGVERADFKYRVIHDPSGEIVFDNIGQDLIIQVLVSLNHIKTQWDGKHIMPKDFITEMRQAMKYAFLISGQNYPKCLDDKLKQHKNVPNKKQKVVIKHRSKPKVENKESEQKVVIRRRSKQTVKIPHRTKRI